MTDISLALTLYYMLYTQHTILSHPHSYVEMCEPLFFPFADEEVKAQGRFLELVAQPGFQPRPANLRP